MLEKIINMLHIIIYMRSICELTVALISLFSGMCSNNMYTRY